MRSPHFTITPRDVQLHATEVLQRHLRFADHGPKCTAPVLWAVLCWAAAHLSSIAAACARLRDAPSDQAVRDALLATLPETQELQRRLNRALVGDLPKALRRRKQPMAIDVILIPYYGQPHADPEELYHGQRKNGTGKFHGYATAYVTRHGSRFTLALTAVHDSDPWDDIVRRLLRQVARTGVKVRYVLLDKGFYSVAVIRYLQAARYPFVMPVIARGRSLKHPRGPSGTRVFCTWKRGGWASYTLTEKKGKRRATVSLCIHRPKGREMGEARGQGPLVYAFWGLKPSSGRWVRETYRSRFGIESSYRQLHQGRIATTTRDPLLRLLFVGVALILRNVWVWLHWAVLARPRRGGRLVDLNQLPLRAMLTWLQQVIETWLGVRDAIHTQRPMIT
jgi:DDE family transposase